MDSFIRWYIHSDKSRIAFHPDEISVMRTWKKLLTSSFFGKVDEAKTGFNPTTCPNVKRDLKSMYELGLHTRIGRPLLILRAGSLFRSQFACFNASPQKLLGNLLANIRTRALFHSLGRCVQKYHCSLVHKQ